MKRCISLAFAFFFLGMVPSARALDVVWNNASGGNWSDISNWASGAIPGAGDKVIITTPGDYTITLDVDVTVSELQVGVSSGGVSPGGNQKLLIGSKTLTLNGPGSVSPFGIIEQTGGTLTGTGTLTVDGAYKWTGGTISGTGNMVVSATGSLELSGGTKQLTSGWSINTAGTATWSGGDIKGNQASAINNTGTFGIVTDAKMVNLNSGSAPVFYNSGTVNKSGGGVTDCGFYFKNFGAINVTGDAVLFTGGGEATGSFDCASSTKVDFAGGTYTLKSGASFTGAGSACLLSGGTVTLDGGATPTVAAGGTFIEVDGVMNGSGELLVNGTFLWKGGKLSGTGKVTVTSSGSLGIMDDSDKTLLGGWTLANAGLATWTGNGNILGYNGGTIANSGTFDIQNDRTFDYQNTGSRPAIVNTGTFKKSGGTGETTIDFDFTHSSGTVTTETGTIRFVAGGTSSAQFDFSNGAQVDFNAGSFSLNSGASFTGNGVPLLSGGTVTLNGPVIAADWSMSGGILSGGVGGSLSVTRQIVWEGGTMTGAGSLVIQGGAALDISGSSAKAMTSGWTINNSGTITWTGSGDITGFGGGTINNSGTFDIQNDQTMDYQNSGANIVVNNTGVLKKTGGTGSTTIEFTLSHTGGSVEVNTGKLLFPAGGSSSAAFVFSNGAQVEFNSGNFDLSAGASFSGDGIPVLSGGKVTLNGAITAPDWSMSGGILSGGVGGSLAISRLITWQGGTMTGAGSLIIQGGATLDISGSSAKAMTSGWTINNSGVITWTGSGDITGFGGGTINNSGTFDIQNDQTMDYQNSGANIVLNNTGVLKKTGGTGSTTIEFTLSHTGGSVEVNTGKLLFPAGGSSSAAFVFSNGAQAEFSSGNFDLSAGASFSGNGIALMSGGTVTLNGAVSAVDWTMTGGTLTGGAGGNLSISRTFIWSGGTMTGSGALTIQGSAGLDIGGSDNKTITTGWTIENNGTITWAGTGNINGYGGGTINNGGTFDVQTDAAFDYLNSGANIVFNNNGSFKKTSGSGASSLEFVFNNSGTVTLTSGSVELRGGGTTTGSVNLSSGTHLSYEAGTHIIDNGASFTGAGLLHLNGATVNLTGSSSAELFSLLDGTLGGTGNLAITGTMDWSDGEMKGSGSVTINPGATLNLTGGNAKTISGGWTLNNSGTINWTGAGHLAGYGGATINNSGLFDIKNDSVFDYLGSGTNPVFNNTGTLRKSADSGDTIMEFAFVNAGTVDVQTGRLLFPSGADFNAGSKFTGSGSSELTGGTFSLNGNIDAGNLEFSSGTLTGIATITGKLVWTGGNMSGVSLLTIASGGTLELSGTGSKKIDGSFILQNQGTINWLKGDWQGATGAAIINSGMLVIDGDLFMDYLNSGTVPIIQNSGTIKKISGAGSANLEFVINNNGVVDAQAGSIQLGGGGFSGGEFKASSGSEVVFTGGTHQLATGASFTGAGFGVLDGGTLSVDGTSAAANFEIRDGLLTGASTLTVSQILNWTGGTLSGGGTLSAANTAAFNINGDDDKSFNGGWTIANAGSAVWKDAGNISGASGAAFNNSGIFDIQTDAVMNYLNSGAVPIINNTGTFKKTAGSGNAVIEFVFNNQNSGLVKGQAGVLQLTGGGNSAGSWFGDAGGLIDFAGGTFSVTGGTFSGDGGSRISGATVNMNGDATATGQFELAAGVIGGSSKLTVGVNSTGPTSVFTWTGGKMSGAGTLQVGLSGLLTISGAGDKQIDGGWMIVNNGQVSWDDAGNITGATGAGIQNNGEFEVNNDQTFHFLNSGATPTFVNAGTFRKTGQSGATTVEFVWSGSGTVDIQSGTLLFPSGAQFDNGAKFTGSGAVQLSGGQFLMQGNIDSANLEFSGGTLTGMNTVAGTFHWTGGAMTGPGTLIVPSGASLFISGAAAKSLNGFSIQNYGTVDWSGTGDLQTANGAGFTNNVGGQFDISAAASMDYLNSGGQTWVVNKGKIHKTGAIGIATIDGFFINEGEVSIDAGHKLGIDGTIGSSTSSILKITLADISGGIQAGKLVVSQTAALQGKLLVDVGNQNYGTSTFDLVTFASGSTVTGTSAFDNIPSGLAPAVKITPKALQLTLATPPTISAINDLVILQSAPNAVVEFTVGDEFTLLSELKLTAVSSNTSLVPNENIFFAGSDTGRTAVVTPAAGEYGRTTIAITVENNAGLKASESFVLAVAPVLTPTTVFGDNIIFNGGAEFGTASSDGSEEVDIPGWLAAGPATVVAYGTGSFPSLGGPGPDDRGENFFSGGDNNAFSSLIQVIDVSAGQTRIDGGGIKYNLSGFFGGFSSQNDNAAMLVEFLDTHGNVLNSAGVGPVGASDRGGNTGLLERHGSGSIPTGTRRIAVHLSMNRTDGSYNDGYADNLSLQLGEPPTISDVVDFSLPENTSKTINFTVSDLETDLNTLGVEVATANPVLLPLSSLTLGGTGATRTLSLQPTPGQTGTAVVTLTVKDDIGSASDSFTVTVTPVNEPPVTVADSRTTAEDTPLTINAADLVSNDLSGVSTGLTVLYFSETDLTGPAFVRLEPNLDFPDVFVKVAGTSLDEDPSFSLRATGIVVPKYSETYTFTTHSDDGVRVRVNGQLIVDNYTAHGETEDSGQINLQAGVPYAIEVEYFEDFGGEAILQLYWASESQAREIIPASAFSNSGSENGQTLTLTAVASPTTAGGTVILNGGVITYTPPANFHGTDTFNYTVTDDGITGTSPDPKTAIGTVQIEVTPVNDAPVIVFIPDVFTEEDATVPTIHFTMTDVDNTDGIPSGFNLGAKSSNQNLIADDAIFISQNGVDFTMTLQLKPDASGQTTITLKVTEGDENSTTSFNVFVTPVNDAPKIVAVTGPLSVNEDTTLLIPAIEIQDVDVGEPSGPISPVSLKPQVIIGSSATAGLLDVELFVDHGVLTLGSIDGLTFLDDTLNGSSRFVVEGPLSSLNTALASLTYLPALNYNGPDALHITVNDLGNTGPAVSGDARVQRVAKASVRPQGSLTPSGLIDTKTIVINVLPVNDPPTITSISAQAGTEDTALSEIAFTIADVESPAADLVVIYDSSIKSLVDNAGISVSSGAGGSRFVTVTPLPNQNGSTVITLTVRDPAGAETSTSFTATFEPVDDEPTIAIPPEGLLAREDTVLNITQIHVADVDLGVPPPPIQPGSVHLQTIISPFPGILRMELEVGHGTLTLNQTTGLEFLDETSNGSSRLQFQGTLVNVNAALQNLAYLPASNFNGEDTLIITADDLGNTGAIPPRPSRLAKASVRPQSFSPVGLVVSEFVGIVVQAVNDLPVISQVPDQSIPENGATAVLPVVIDDVETPASELMLTATSSNPVLVPNAGLVLGGSGNNRTIKVTPAPAQSGTAIITLKAVDELEGISTSTFTLTVVPSNQAPGISNVTDKTTNEDVPLVVDFTIGDAETPVASLTVTGESSNKTLVPDANIKFANTTADRTATITPAKDQSGTTTITLKVTDGGGAFSTDTFVLTVTPVNDAPTISEISGQSIPEDGGPRSFPFTLGDVDNNADGLTVTGSSSNQSLVPDSAINITGSGASRLVTLQSVPDGAGSTTITLKVSDGALTATTSFALQVTQVNDPPVIAPISDQSTTENKPVKVTINFNDIDSPINFLSVSALSSNTALVPNSNIKITGLGTTREAEITPLAGQSGATTITVFVSDSSGTTTSTSFNLAVAAVNDPPTISKIVNQTMKQGSTLGPIAFTISDPDNDASSLKLSAAATVTGLFPPSAIQFGGSGVNRTLTLTPVSTQSGSSTIFVTVSDGELTATVNFDVEVQFVNSPPEIGPIPNQTIMEDGSTGLLDFGVFDRETPATQLTLSGESSNPKLVPVDNIVFSGAGVNRAVTVTPATNQSGVVTIAIIVKDANDGSVTNRFDLTVQEVNDLPTISALSPVSLLVGETNKPVAFTVGDVETPVADLKVTATSSDPTVVPPENITLTGSGAERTIIVQAGKTKTGVATITVTVQDASGGSAAASFDVTVKASEPVIRTQPTGLTVKSGGDATFTVVAEGLNLVYQWRLNDKDLPGENKSELALKGVSFTQGGRYTVRVSNETGGVVSQPAQLVVLVAPTIITSPASQTVDAGKSGGFSVTANGTAPLLYQWQFNEADLPGENKQTISITNASPAKAGRYRVIVSNAAGSVTSDVANLTVHVPPSVTDQPRSQTVQAGQRVVFTVVVGGNGPFTYQWRLNGVNLPGETRDTLVIDPVQASNSGSYTVVIVSPTGTATSDPAVLTVIVPQFTLTDNFADRVLLSGPTGSIQGDNFTATSETGEPRHVGRRAETSVWAKWVAPGDGLATFSTTGSSFDTRLAVYTGAALASLAEVASDEDNGGFLTSLVTFNVRSGVEYQIVVDGFGAARGKVVLTWNFELSQERTPRILRNPQDLAVAEGADAEFTVDSVDATGFLWFHNGVPLLGERNSRLTLRGVTEAELGLYLVELSNGSRTIRSAAARLQVNVSENGSANSQITTEDKFKDAVDSGSGEGFSTAGTRRPGAGRSGAALARGYTGTQIFNSYGSTTEENEPNHCGVLGGASQWFSYLAEADGTLQVSTGGSDFDTVLAIYTGPGTDFESLQLVACDDNSGPNGITSLVEFPVVAGTTYYVAVDGALAATGTVKLSYKLTVPLRFNANSLAQLPNGEFRLELAGSKPGFYTIQTTTNMVDWATLTSTNTPTGVISITDTNAPSILNRFYRAIFGQ